MKSAPAEVNQLEDIEIELLLEGMYRHYGFDFRNYAPASIKRRIHESMRSEGVLSVSGFQEKVLHDPACLERLLYRLSVNVTSMFRDPTFFQTFRAKVVPLLRTYPFVRIWHAGCSTGEEVYSMAILLQEEDLYQRCRIYATDMSKEVLRKAREGIFPLASMQEYTANYMKAGGQRFFSDYYTAHYDSVIFSSSLKTNLIFSEHNLVTDGSFNEFHVILCRNVMIYFNKTLQERVHNLIYESLSVLGVFGLGNKESLRFTPRESFYEELDHRDRLYRKVR
ncbi:MAG: chemotaxis protein methyltransferase CheR [Blastocatellia bacterium]|jgi:chemotaxis protein methyltransferase CheR|nr:chemotaxis protein methyltransferase CheR [Blastocatellia bacterium]